MRCGKVLEPYIFVLTTKIQRIQDCAMSYWVLVNFLSNFWNWISLLSDEGQIWRLESEPKQDDGDLFFPFLNMASTSLRAEILA